jgi:hypothetical protein
LAEVEDANGIWSGDLLGRRSDADLLLRFLRSRTQERLAAGEPGAYVLNLNAEWGQGKTYFLQRLGRQLEAEGTPVAYVNAWRDDASGAPMVAVMAAIEEALRPHLKGHAGATRLWGTAKKAAGKAAIAATKGVVKRVIRQYRLCVNILRWS